MRIISNDQPCLACRAAPLIYNYTSPVSGNTYYLVNTPANQADAQTQCNRLGGHLAWYKDINEQVRCLGAAWLYCTVHCLLQSLAVPRNLPWLQHPAHSGMFLLLLVCAGYTVCTCHMCADRSA